MSFLHLHILNEVFHDIFIVECSLSITISKYIILAKCYSSPLSDVSPTGCTVYCDKIHLTYPLEVAELLTTQAVIVELVSGR